MQSFAASARAYDQIVLTAGFSKAYSSLLAFVACPTWLKQHLKVTVPSYIYSGPVPVASLASALLGLEVNRRRGDDLRVLLWHANPEPARAPGQAGHRHHQHLGPPPGRAGRGRP